MMQVVNSMRTAAGLQRSEMSNTNESHRSRKPSNWPLLALVAAAVAVWGLLLAVGAYLQPGADVPERDPRRFWIVLGCVAGFLAVWGLALWLRRGRSGR